MNGACRADRVIVIVLDSVGVGALPDAPDYGDAGANTLLHVAERAGGLRLPRLQAMGLGNILEVPGVPGQPGPSASFGMMREASKGKDTIAGHWELMGIILDRPFALHPDGFPEEMMAEFLRCSGFAGALGNRSASGTVIIQELGAEHVRTGLPIVYTSADSVFQIAAHESVIPLERLYEACRKARSAFDRFRIGRIIARPFTGEAGAYRRTAHRKDFPMKPPADTVLDLLEASGTAVVSVGKIENIFAGRGITRSLPAAGNEHGMACLKEALADTERGLIFANLIDFDMLYGHRNDAQGYAAALEAFDAGLETFLPLLRERDVLIITADHGCDPTHPGTDHTREHVPLLVYGKSLAPRDLGIRKTFADVGATVLFLLGVEHRTAGRSVLEEGF